jgi:hypothetical protein
MSHERILVCEGPAEMVGREIEVELDFDHPRNPKGFVFKSENEWREWEKIAKLMEEGVELLSPVMTFTLSNKTYRALEVVCRGNNWQKIAFALAGIFHAAEYFSRRIDLRVLKARGYDRLRGLVEVCVFDLRHSDHKLPNDYNRLVERLYTSQGRQAP